MSLLDLYPEHLQTLLQTMPVLPRPLVGYQTGGPTIREYGDAVKKFMSVFAMASGAYFERESADGIYMPHLAMYEQASGFYSTCADTNPFCDEDMQEAVSNAREEEKLACEEIARLIQDKTFSWKVRVAHGATLLNMAYRGLNARDLADNMVKSVWTPERTGRGLPELLRNVTSHGGLATAVWLAVVEEKLVGEAWCDMLLAHPDWKYATPMVNKARLKFKLHAAAIRWQHRTNHYYEYEQATATTKHEHALLEKERMLMKRTFVIERENILREIEAIPDGE